ncbi:conserved Plasmodium protein, unknown function [Plasmodium knowlesi strain H]|uniref:Uncharacterized protein n=3 Tax=Plasmodium knowlesi TaxID=5850 RepID=A0A5K1VQF9_PLAKH|nr:conserved Plasmodium protein, unknown function [Plasmodium knowlesi strain H]OTN63730.1 Uncharacterized protein PKNOH_S140243300 [Plasmodium knowlesi]CAA9990852.1 conserved Plasmodium protein, unknown function [Plasmodium knowlesi strain H]SBO20938.1 conserved Plasmodium protein, unknown function [Plasmodium knowlesi strain H]SBO21427.1 conserved Plasmodium protein, unknown function [Plasmodium knowlesi strain H]VVS80326.1 conserved Plasmodium protein, unknown function [Plasmodium knowlesi |eukprot:XP_002262140.1 hypothetical protein, conserved in Plasmodium species [Plasmodium knowlesi strain H]
MSKSVRRGEIYFNGVFKYYKKKSLPVHGDAGYGDLSTERGYVCPIREKNSTHRIGRKREKDNHADDNVDWEEDTGLEIDKIDEGEETEKEREDEQEEQRGRKPKRLQQRGEKWREKPLDRSKEQNRVPPKLTAITGDAVEAPVRRTFPEGILKKRYLPKPRNVYNSNAEYVGLNVPPEFNKMDISLNDKSGSAGREYSNTLNKKGKGKKPIKSKNSSPKKKCTFKKSILLRKKKARLNEAYDNPIYFDMYHSCDAAQLRGNRSYIRKNKKKINGENCKYKYELPTIASLGKAKKLNYLNFTINEDEMTKQQRMLLDNLSNVCFGGNLLYNVAQPCKKLRRKKVKPYL